MNLILRDKQHERKKNLVFQNILLPFCKMRLQYDFRDSIGPAYYLPVVKVDWKWKKGRWYKRYPRKKAQVNVSHRCRPNAPEFRTEKIADCWGRQRDSGGAEKTAGKWLGLLKNSWKSSQGQCTLGDKVKKDLMIINSPHVSDSALWDKSPEPSSF